MSRVSGFGLCFDCNTFAEDVKELGLIKSCLSMHLEIYSSISAETYAYLCDFVRSMSRVSGFGLCFDCNTFGKDVKELELVSDCKKCCNKDSDDSKIKDKKRMKKCLAMCLQSCLSYQKKKERKNSYNGICDSYTPMIDIFDEAGMVSSMKYVFQHMQEQTLEVDVRKNSDNGRCDSYTPMIDIFDEAGMVSSMKYVFQHMQELTLEVDVVTYIHIALLHWFSKNGDFEEMSN
ncbi:hypothetical protein Syun_004427 [Stephania yunnanensis]|uniref:Uncharacterized protein n=1 Tax=Stephania yunnanensis TaxID=152371 RepID=A0AAP0Q1F1_9MAGN